MMTDILQQWGAAATEYMLYRGYYPEKKMCFDYCYPKVAWFQRTLFSLCVLPIIPPKVFCEF